MATPTPTALKYIAYMESIFSLYKFELYSDNLNNICTTEDGFLYHPIFSLRIRRAYRCPKQCKSLLSLPFLRIRKRAKMGLCILP